MKTQVFKIGGMSCAACSANVEKTASKLSGVKEASVNLTTEKLTITYNEELLNPEQIIAAVENIGYKARVMDENEKPVFNDKTDKRASAGVIAALILAAIMLYVSMGTMLFNFPMPNFVSMNHAPLNFALLQMLIAICVMVLGRKYFISGYRGLIKRVPNMDSLVAMSCTVSFVYSLVSTFKIAKSGVMEESLYFESCAVVLALIMLGKHLEAGSKKKTKNAIRALVNLAPAKAILINNGVEREIAAEDLEVGNLVLVKPGCAFPADGIIIDGETKCDESMLTGESVPVPKTEGDKVIGGSINLGKKVYVKVKKIGADTVLSQIIKLVEDAQGKKAPIASLADKIAGIFVPVVMGIALVAFAVWLIIGQTLAFALKIFTCVLVVACPCALGLATPTAVIVGTGLGAGKGILIKSGEALQAAAYVDTVVFDKTGTLTLGIIKDDVNTEEDKLRPESKEAVAALKKAGLKVYMLSGDKEEVAKKIAAETGIDNVIAGVLPGGKSDEIAKLQAGGAKVMMVGDGINDAPALSLADVGLAIGNGTDVAIESADIVLMRSDPRDVFKAIRLSKMTLTNIKENLFWAFIYNCIGIPVAAGALYPAFGILMSPMVGGLAMALSSIFVVSNALRLRTKKL